MFYEPRNGHGLPHDPSKAIVAPRPIGWISTLDAEGRANLAPYSFFNMVSGNPFIVMFSSESIKDSATNAVASGEFVCNLVGRELAEAMNRSSVNAPHGVDEFDYARLEKAECRLVKAPRVAAASAALECKVTQSFHPVAADGRPAQALIVMGEVVGVHILESALADGLFDMQRVGNVARLGYMDFSAIDATFQMRRPRWDDG